MAKAKLKLEIDEDTGLIAEAKENGHPLQYDPSETKRMDDGTTAVRSNPCTWRKRNGRWICI
jgi:hypothetical protein